MLGECSIISIVYSPRINEIVAFSNTGDEWY